MYSAMYTLGLESESESECEFESGSVNKALDSHTLVFIAHQSANTSKASITVDVTSMSVSLIGSSGSNVFVALSPSSFCDTFWMSYPFDPNNRDLRRKYDQD